MKMNYTIYMFLLTSSFFIGCDQSDKKSEVKTSPVYSENTELDSLIKANPNNSELFYQRSRLHYDKQLFPKALIDVLYAIDLNKKSVSSYLLASDIYIQMNQGQDAIDLMSQAINNNPGKEVLYERAIEYNFYLQNFQAALNFANDLLKINKNNPNAYFFKGLIHKQKDIDKAISNFQTTVEQDPSYYNAYMQLGILYSSKKDKIALQYFDNALRLEPTSREAIYGKGYFYQTQKQYNLAKSEYKKLIIANRKDIEAIYNLGYCLMEQDSNLRASNHFDMVLGAKPDHVDALFLQAQLSERLGDIKNAKILYHNALKILPENETILQALKELKAKE